MNWARDITGMLRGAGGWSVPKGLDGGRIELTEPILIPSGAELEGIGDRSRLHALGDFPAIKTLNVDGTKAEGVRISGLRITRENTIGEVATAQTTSDGIQVWGDDITLEEVSLEDHFIGLQSISKPDDLSGTATSVGVNSSTDSTKAMTVDAYAGRWYWDLTTGIAFLITSNTATVFTLDADGATPTAGTYLVLVPAADQDMSHDLVLRRVRTSHSNPSATTSQYGLRFDAVSGLTICETRAQDAWLDGLKIRRSCGDVLVDGGRYCNNRNDGIDAYGGGGRMTLRNVHAHDNGVGTACVGLNVKTSLANPALGAMRAIEVLHCRARGNGASGLSVERDVGGVEEPQVQHVLIQGGEYSENGNEGDNQAGVRINARSVEVDGVLAIGNEGAGLWVREGARDVRVRGGRFAANGADLAANANIIVSGQRVHIDHPVLLGKDGADVYDDTTFDALDEVTDYAVYIVATARDVTVDLRASDSRGHAISDRLSVAAGGKVVVHTEGDGAPTGVYGGPGSTYARRDGGAATCLYVKESVDHDSTGWVAK